MTFPKSPAKSVSGRLRLMIRPAGASVEVETTPELPPGSDDGDIKFKLPPGFGLDTDLDDVLARQLVAAIKGVKEIEARYQKCSNCRKKDYNPEGLVVLLDAITTAGIHLKGKLPATSRIILGHEKTGDISLEVGIQDRSVILMVRKSGNILGKYERHIIQGEAPFSDEEWQSMLLWTIGL